MNTISEAYHRAYAKLNKEQKKAVDKTDGPVMVLAGPGTGKTQILAARVGNILLQSDTRAEEILCLTFTDAGVRAMRKRLLEFIGPEAFKVEIHTFHSFCNSVVRQNLEYFSISELELLSEIEEVELLRDLIDKAGAPIKKKTTEAYYEARNLKKIFEFVQKENIDVPQLIKQAKDYLVEIPTLEKFQYKVTRGKFTKGDPKPSAVDPEVKSINKLIASLEQYPAYKKMLAEKKRFTFSDMILWVIKAFKEEPNVLADFQERYQYFFVDEYQDTSGAQQEVLSLLTSFWDAPNLFVVGDDDQAIYRFQGASLENVIELYNKHKKDMLFISLKDNYRSSQNILDRAQYLIKYNKERLVNHVENLSTELQSATDLKNLPGGVHLLEYENYYAELAGVANAVKGLVKKGIATNEIAIIYRKHAQAEDLVRFFSHSDNQIPCAIQRKMNVLESPTGVRLILVLKWLEAESKKPNSGNHFFIELLYGGMCAVQPLEISKLCHMRKMSRELKGMSWREILSKVDEIESVNASFSNEIISHFKEYSVMLEGFLIKLQEYPLYDVISEIIKESKLLISGIKKAQGYQAINQLLALYKYVKEGFERRYFSDLSQFISHLHLLEKYGIKIEAKNYLGDSGGVQLSTVHGVKGLEFDKVFMIGCTEKDWNGSANKKSPYKLPPGGQADYLNESPEELAAEDERRLFYVGMTRAKSGVFMSYHKLKDDKEVKPANQMVELMAAEDLEMEKPVVEEEVLEEFLSNILTYSEMPKISLIDESLLKKFKENYSLSATHLNNYVKCPLSFYFNNVLGIPSEGSPAMSYGNALHYALDQYISANEPENKTREKLKSNFTFRIRLEKGSFPDERSFSNYLEKGIEALELMYSKKLSTLNEEAAAEKKHVASINGILINGRVDKSTNRGNERVFIDFKSGNPQNVYKYRKTSPPLTADELAKKKNPIHSQKSGGDYWRQAIFYKLLADYDPNAKSIDKFIFEMLDPNPDTGNLDEIEMLIQPEHEKIVLAQMEKSWNGIAENKFNEGCGDAKCHWCNFVKKYDIN